MSVPFDQPPVSTAVLGRRVLQDAGAHEQRARARATAGRKVVSRWLASESRVEWVPPSFGITGFVRLPALLSDAKVSEHLRRRYDTQVVPGSMFEAPGFVRLSFGIDPGDLEQGLANFSATLDDLA